MSKGRVTINKDYIERMMSQIQNEVQDNSALHASVKPLVKERWKESSYYKEKMKEIDAFLKQISQVESGYRKFNENLLAFWLIYRGDRVLGQGGYGDVAETLVHIEELKKSILLPNVAGGDYAELFDKGNSRRGPELVSRSTTKSKVSIDINGSTYFNLASSFRLVSSPNDIPKVDNRQIVRALEEQFGTSDLVASRNDIGAVAGGTINTIFNISNIRDHMFGKMEESVFPVNHKHVKHYFEKAGGRLPTKGDITAAKVNENRKVQAILDKMVPRRAHKSGRVVIQGIRGVDFFEDFREKAKEVESFLKNFEGYVATQTWKANSAAEAYRNYQTSSEPKIVDFPEYGYFNEYLETFHYGTMTEKVQRYAAWLGETPQSLYEGNYHELSLYRLSEFYHGGSFGSAKNVYASRGFSKIVGR